jgi:hypothetical protein
MKVAIIYTGALRTIKKTMRYFKQNLLLNPNVDVFACLQNDTQESNQSIETWIRQEIGSHLKNIQWFNPSEHSDWISIRDKMLSNLSLTDHWKNYIKNSGSIIEYYQLYLAYQKMCYYEDTHQRYNYIIRSRTDTIFAKPVDFHWLSWSDSEVETRIQRINEELELSEIEITPLNTFKYFMTTILSDQLIPNIQNIISNYIPNKHTEIPHNSSELNNYIKNGSYILTLRANNLYIVNRELFNFIPTISFVYGYLKSPHNDGYWFNAEGQFQAACYFSDLTIFDYNTLFEDKSLYEYDEKRYFDLQYNILNPFMVYCLIRY